eukprot:scaffold24221_cov127-Cylindrotheca_fusiformis.AAC.1
MIRALKDQMKTLVEDNWDPYNEKVDTFGTDSAANAARGDYFLDSSNTVHYFAEPKAFPQKEDAKEEEKEEINKDKMSILNKAGHGMHTIPGTFQDYTRSEKMKNLVLDLGWKDPVVPQSMYIFKQGKIGGPYASNRVKIVIVWERVAVSAEIVPHTFFLFLSLLLLNLSIYIGTVHSHQDSTFLFTTPRQTCLGLWLALDDATLDNGCLWVRPGSHKEPLRRQFIRNPDYFDSAKPDGSNNTPKLTFRQHHDNPNVSWEGDLPNTSLLEAGFIPVEVKAGDLVTFCGTLDHLSLPNFSNLPRHTFQLHLVEGPNEGITWSPSNWLQYPQGESFMKLVNDEKQ